MPRLRAVINSGMVHAIFHVIFCQCFYLFFYGRLILRPWLTEVRESFTRGVMDLEWH